MAKAHPSNAPGPFYVEEGCCISCGVPHDVAPEIFAWAEGERHCFVARQPRDGDEIDRTLRALWSAETDCIRYRGSDPALVKRIAELGGGAQLDTDPGDVGERFRDLVTFRSAIEQDSAGDLADRFRAQLGAHAGPCPYHLRPRRAWRPTRVVFSWTVGVSRWPQYHSVTFAARSERKGRFEARLSSAWAPARRGLAIIVQDWLKSSEAAQDVRWFSLDELYSGAPGFHAPF